MSKNWNPELSSGKPISLSFKELDGKLVGNVEAGQHRILSIIDRLGPDATVGDIPKGMFKKIEANPDVFEIFHNNFPTMGNQYDYLFGR